MNIDKLSELQKRLIPLLVHTWKESPTWKDEILLDDIKTFKVKDKTLLEKEIQIGFSGYTFYPGIFGYSLTVQAKTIPEKFRRAVKLLGQTIDNDHIKVKPVRKSISVLLNKAFLKKNDPLELIYDIHNEIYHKKKSIMRMINIVRQHQFLGQLNDSFPVIDELHNVTSTLLRPENVFVFIAADAKKLSKDISPLSTLFNFTSYVDQKMLSRRFQSKNFDEDIKKENDKDIKHIVFSMKGLEKCYLMQSVTIINTNGSEEENLFEVI